MENEPFINDFHNKTSIHRGLSIAMLDDQRVIHPVRGLMIVTLTQIHPIMGHSTNDLLQLGLSRFACSIPGKNTLW